MTPTGEIVAVRARGTLMGNRGCLHDDAGRIVRHHRGRRWIACLLDVKGRHRDPMPPGRYTSLFFLDEATALAAGHRPCFECRREDARAFHAKWNSARGSSVAGVDPVDRVLHAERTAGPHEGDAAGLPDGAMIDLGGVPHLVLGDRVLPWDPSGYGAPAPRPVGTVRVLTPPSVVGAMRAGYVPALHHSAVQARQAPASAAPRT